LWIDRSTHCYLERERIAFWNGGFQHYRCVEGYKVYVLAEETCQAVIFRDGTVEFLDQYAFGKDDNNRYLHVPTFEKYVFDCCARTFQLYTEGLLEMPVAVVLTLKNISGYVLTTGVRHFSRVAPPPITENEIQSDMIVLSEPPADSKGALKPLLDFIWNGFGHPRSMGYNEEGNYVGYGRQ
jgi:hypothetical protein